MRHWTGSTENRTKKLGRSYSFWATCSCRSSAFVGKCRVIPNELLKWNFYIFIQTQSWMAFFKWFRCFTLKNYIFFFFISDKVSFSFCLKNKLSLIKINSHSNTTKFFHRKAKAKVSRELNCFKVWKMFSWFLYFIFNN